MCMDQDGGRPLDPEASKKAGDPTGNGPGTGVRTTIGDVPFTRAELEAACVGPDPALSKKSDESGTFFQDLETKRRVYIDSPADAPEGAKIEEGDEGGTFYNTDDVEAFEEAIASINERVRENMDFDEEQWEEASALQSQYEARAPEMFESIVEASGVPGDTQATHRVKSKPSMLEKAFEREDTSAESLDELEDVFGAKFVPGDIDEVREVTDQLKENLGEEMDLESVEVDDRLEPEESTYYRAVHIDFETEDGLAGEIQVKSEQMERIIDVGHDTVFKNNAGLDEDTVEQVDECLTAQMDALFGDPADPDDACTEEAREAIQAVA